MHLLACAHQIGKNRQEYFMRCEIIKEMPDDGLKVKVFGDRFWKGSNKTSIRYVNASRVING